MSDRPSPARSGPPAARRRPGDAGESPRWSPRPPPWPWPACCRPPPRPPPRPTRRRRRRPDGPPRASAGRWSGCLTVTDNGPSQAEQITATDTLPTALSFVSGDAACTSGRTVTCGPLPRLAPGASITWVIKVKPAPEYTGNGSDIRNTATVDALTADPRPANNTSAAAGPPAGTVKTPTADLEVGKTTP